MFAFWYGLAYLLLLQIYGNFSGWDLKIIQLFCFGLFINSQRVDWLLMSIDGYFALQGQLICLPFILWFVHRIFWWFLLYNLRILLYFNQYSLAKFDNFRILLVESASDNFCVAIDSKPIFGAICFNIDCI